MRLGLVLKALAGVVTAAIAVLLLAVVADRVVLDRRSSDSTPTPTTSAAGRRDLFVLPDDGASVVLDEFAAATRSIDIAVYLLTADAVVTELGDAVERGVRVRAILEPDPFGGFGDVEAEAAHLRSLGVEVRFSGAHVRFSHVKTFIVDDRVALVTSLNLTNAALTGNRELGIVTTVSADVRSAQEVFAADWDGTVANPDAGTLIVSPTNSRATIEGMISSAETSVDLYAEVIRDDAVIGLLIERATVGVTVRVIVPDEVSPDDLGVYGRLASGGVEVRVMGTPYQHAKMVLVDGERALIGSINFTSTSMDDNREIGVVVDDAISVDRLAAVFASDWANGRLVSKFGRGHEKATAAIAGWLGSA